MAQRRSWAFLKLLNSKQSIQKRNGIKSVCPFSIMIARGSFIVVGGFVAALSCVVVAFAWSMVWLSCGLSLKAEQIYRCYRCLHGTLGGYR